MAVAVIVLSIVSLTAIGLAGYAFRGWVLEKQARLAAERKADAVTQERNDERAAKETALDRAARAEKLAGTGLRGKATTDAKEAHEVLDDADPLNAARARVGLPPLPDAGVPDVPAAAAPGDAAGTRPHPVPDRPGDA